MFWIMMPKNDNAGRPIRGELLDRYVEEVSDEFGGASVIPNILGCWDSDRTRKGGLVCEENALIMVTPETKPKKRESDPDVPWTMEEARQKIHDIALEIGVTLGQRSVMTSSQPTASVFIPGMFQPELPRDMVTLTKRRWNSEH